MSNPSANTKTASPSGPDWVTLQGQESSEEDVKIVSFTGPTFNKKRKGGERDSTEYTTGGGSGIKRPRHSIPSTVRNESLSKLGSSSGSGASAAILNPVTKQSAASRISGQSQGGKRLSLGDGSKPPARPIPRLSLGDSSNSNGKTGETSTASALAALYPASATHVADSSIEQRREKHQESAIKPQQEIQQNDDPTKDKGKGKAKASPTLAYLGDLSDGVGSSHSEPTRKVDLGSSNATASGSGSSTTVPPRFSRPSLGGKGPVRCARKTSDRYPLYVNGTRQTARKTSRPSKPPKIYNFDRELPSSGGSNEGSDSSSPSNSLTPARRPVAPTAEGVAEKGASSAQKKPDGVHKPTSDLPSQNSAPKGKSFTQRRTPLKHSSSPDVIVITSSDDDMHHKRISKNISRGPAPKSPGKTLLSNIKREKQEKNIRRHTIGGPMDLTAALNKGWRAQKAKTASRFKRRIEDNLIDLTLDDSDETATRAPDARMKSPEPPKANQIKEEHISPTKPLLIHQASSQILTTPPPATPLIPAPAFTNELIRPKTAMGLISEPIKSPKPDSSPRPRSVPMVPPSDATTSFQRSQSPASFSETNIPRKFTLHSRRPIVQSPGIGETESAEEQEVLNSMIVDGAVEAQRPPSDREVSVKHPPDRPLLLRRTTRHSSASSQNEVDNIARLTEVESPPESSASPEPLDGSEPPSYGGFKAFTWEHHKKNIKNFGFEFYSTNDLPTSLPDNINRLSDYARSNAGIRDTFQAYILENIFEDEVGAPPIEILNDIDAEPSPDFEFIYSNKMWYREGVPKPDFSKLKGCGCIGRCDPKSKSCICVKKQREYLLDDGCVYEKNGRLKFPHASYPILECNDLCSCDDDCRNRVVQHGRKCQISIRKTRLKGWGVFNGPKRIPAGTFLGIYAGELLTDEQSEVRGRYYNSIGKTYLFDIDFYHLKREEDTDWRNKYTVDAYHAGNFTRFLNHSCDPNARLHPCYTNEPDIEKPLLAVFSTRDIGPNEEICFNYMGRYPEDGVSDDEVDEEEMRANRNDPVYNECKCGARNCTGAMF